MRDRTDRSSLLDAGDRGFPSILKEPITFSSAVDWSWETVRLVATFGDNGQIVKTSIEIHIRRSAESRLVCTVAVAVSDEIPADLGIPADQPPHLRYV